MKKKYKIIPEDLQKSLIDFLDEIQFDAASDGDSDSMHKVNFCQWAINELLNSFDGYVVGKSNNDEKTPKKKKREDYVDETFMDWNLPEMSDEEYEKLVDSFDNFLRAWETEYNKKNKNNPKKKPIKERKPKFERPDINLVAEFMSLDEIKDYLLDDPELTDHERFELYYEERERFMEREELKNAQTLDEMMKDLNIKHPPTKK
jgi:hypothetical protein